MARQQQTIDDGKGNEIPVAPAPPSTRPPGAPNIDLPPIDLPPTEPVDPNDPNPPSPSVGTEIGKRNISLAYHFSDNQNFIVRSFYAHKKFMTIEDETIGEKKLATGEIRRRWKKRRVINLELPFFEPFNQPDTNNTGGYREFEFLINLPNLLFAYRGDDNDFYPYNNKVDIADTKAPWVWVRLKEKKVEYLDELIDKKILVITFEEAESWYFTS
jgi:hypothetical protein